MAFTRHQRGRSPGSRDRRRASVRARTGGRGRRSGRRRFDRLCRGRYQTAGHRLAGRFGHGGSPGRALDRLRHAGRRQPRRLGPWSGGRPTRTGNAGRGGGRLGTLARLVAGRLGGRGSRRTMPDCGTVARLDFLRVARRRRRHLATTGRRGADHRRRVRALHAFRSLTATCGGLPGPSVNRRGGELAGRGNRPAGPHRVAARCRRRGLRWRRTGRCRRCRPEGEVARQHTVAIVDLQRDTKHGAGERMRRRELNDAAPVRKLPDLGLDVHQQIAVRITVALLARWQRAHRNRPLAHVQKIHLRAQGLSGGTQNPQRPERQRVGIRADRPEGEAQQRLHQRQCQSSTRTWSPPHAVGHWTVLLVRIDRCEVPPALSPDQARMTSGGRIIGSDRTPNAAQCRAHLGHNAKLHTKHLLERPRCTHPLCWVS